MLQGIFVVAANKGIFVGPEEICRSNRTSPTLA